MEQEPKPRIGRPPKAPEDILIQRSIRLSAGEWDKIKACGGLPWLRQLIAKARPPKG